MKVFVSVGSTSFDNLIQTVDSEEIKKLLQIQGYTQTLCQIGKGKYIPTCPYFQFDYDLQQRIEQCHLLICHAGAGTILTGIRLNKKIIAVVNPFLMDNHQKELAQALFARKCVIMCNGVEELPQAVICIQISLLEDFEFSPLQGGSINSLNTYILESISN